MATLFDVALETWALQQGLVTESELYGLFTERQRLAQEGLPAPTAELLVSQELVTSNQLERALEKLRSSRFTCPGCTSAHPFSELPNRATSWQCPECQHELTASSGLTLEDQATPPPDGRPISRHSDLEQTAPAPPHNELLGQEFGGLILDQVIGLGGMGCVYHAIRTEDHTEAAIKILSRDAARQYPTAVERFLREASILRKLHHPAIVELWDMGEKHGYHFLVMEYLSGANWAELIAGKAYRKRPLNWMLRQMLDVCEGLQAAHRAGVIHRDLKPENIVLGKDHRPRLTDFGLARGVSPVTPITEVGEILGTPYYMAPEQGDGAPCTPLTDIYSLGIAFYHFATGRLPFVGDTAIATILLHQNQPPPDLRGANPQISEGLAQVILKMIAKAPESRYPSLRELIGDLELLLSGQALTGLGKIAVRCLCGRRLSYLGSESGSLRKCPNCQRSLYVPRQQLQAPPAPNANRRHKPPPPSGRRPPRAQTNQLIFPSHVDLFFGRVVVVNRFSPLPRVLELLCEPAPEVRPGSLPERLVKARALKREDAARLVRLKWPHYLKKADVLFGQIAVANDQVEKEQVQRALTKTQQSGVRLAQMLEEEEMLESHHIEAINRAIRKYRRDREDALFARHAFAQGMALMALKRCWEIQQARFGQSGGRLAEVISERKLMPLEQAVTLWRRVLSTLLTEAAPVLPLPDMMSPFLPFEQALGK